MRRLHPFVFAVLAAASARADVGGAWIGPLPPLSIARQEVGATRSGTSIYVVGGLIDAPGLQATATVERFRPSTNAWTFTAPLPAPRDHLGVCALGGLVYAIGGFAGDFVARAEVWAYDASHDTWTARAPLPSARGACVAVAHGSRIYVFGGVDSAGSTRSSTFVYDPSANAWTPGADMPTAREHLMAVALGPHVYVVGGRVGPALAANERYDPVSNTWTTRAPMPTARSASGMAVDAGRIVVLGGETPVLHAVNEVYDPVANAWSTQDPMPLPRHGFASVEFNGLIHCIGGGVVQGFQPTVQHDVFVPLSAQAQHACECAAFAPCGNTASEAGCRNSTGAGGELTATGVASVSSDSLVLRASALPSATSALFVQGTQLENGGAGTPFGDGLRCAGGSVIRLATRAAMSGNASYPGSGDVSVSARGLVAGPGQRHYQVWYRNVVGPCGTGSNLTNAVTVAWGL